MSVYKRNNISPYALGILLFGFCLTPVALPAPKSLPPKKGGEVGWIESIAANPKPTPQDVDKHAQKAMNIFTDDTFQKTRLGFVSKLADAYLNALTSKKGFFEPHWLLNKQFVEKHWHPLRSLHSLFFLMYNELQGVEGDIQSNALIKRIQADPLLKTLYHGASPQKIRGELAHKMIALLQTFEKLVPSKAYKAGRGNLDEMIKNLEEGMAAAQKRDAAGRGGVFGRKGK